jgi:Rrf2 family protein
MLLPETPDYDTMQGSNGNWEGEGAVEEQQISKKQPKACPSTYKTFSLSLQALVILAKHSSLCPSSDIAQDIQSEATLLRRILSVLSRENIIETREGREGGYRLSKRPEEITLAEVYAALHIDEARCVSMTEATGENPFGVKMKAVMYDITSEIDQSILNVLEKYTIQDLVNRTYELD